MLGKKPKARSSSREVAKGYRFFFLPILVGENLPTQNPRVRTGTKLRKPTKGSDLPSEVGIDPSISSAERAVVPMGKLSEKMWASQLRGAQVKTPVPSSVKP